MNMKRPTTLSSASIISAALAIAAAQLAPAVPAAAQQPIEREAPAWESDQIMIGSQLPGAFFAKPQGRGDANGQFPVLILLGGSEGGDRSARALATRFLKHGFAVLGLPYYSPAWFGNKAQFEELPRAFDSIPVENLQIARNWLTARDDVRAQDIGIYGVSKGAEYALLAGSLIDGFAAIAAIVPSDVVWEGWGPGTTPGAVSSFSWQGEALPFVPYIGMQEAFKEMANTVKRVRLRIPHDRGRNAYPERAVAARINVENIDEPVLVAGGDADDVWNSGEMAQYIAERRASAGLPSVSLIFTDAGHSLSGTGEPNDYSSEAEIEAQKVIWPATLDFFRAHLMD